MRFGLELVYQNYGSEVLDYSSPEKTQEKNWRIQIFGAWFSGDGDRCESEPVLMVDRSSFEVNRALDLDELREWFVDSRVGDLESFIF